MPMLSGGSPSHRTMQELCWSRMPPYTTLSDVPPSGNLQVLNIENTSSIEALRAHYKFLNTGCCYSSLEYVEESSAA
ncbi:hypothetical protein XENTR_v10001683 [Xenopus tropicalis]|nr:hypothetical protein XENTR_v10001683 [Xenopus tropicalis]KAE8632819.1 hypothetical protein XENTR_v10001683 [Xenopus tropicalis]KAE8632820.1 hypothetical protein XENTR_v10001683 [Xenopus tropicalis]